MPSQIDLSVLKDIHTPDNPPFFPPAPGWWILFAITLLIICVLVVLKYRLSPKRYALRILNKIECSDRPFAEQAVQINILLKRVALKTFPREKVASLSGKAWSRFLLQAAPDTLSEQQAQFLANSTYLPKQKAVAIPQEKLYTAVEKWITSVFKRTQNEAQKRRHSVNRPRHK